MSSEAAMSAVPVRWKLVPVDPTETMIRALWKETLGGSILAAERAGRAMLAAAPEPPALETARAAPGEVERLRLREALTPTGETKCAYMGEFSWTEWLPDEDGIEQGHERIVPWTTVKEIMKAIRERAEVDMLDKADCHAALSEGRGEVGS